MARLKDAMEEIRNVTYVNVQNSFQKNISSIENIVLLVSSYAHTICNYKKKKKIIPSLEKILLKLKNIFFFSANAFLSTSWSLTSAFGNGILTMITLLFGAFGLMFNLILFFTCLFYLLSAKQSVLQTFRNLMAKMQAQQLTVAIFQIIISAFTCKAPQILYY